MSDAPLRTSLWHLSFKNLYKILKLSLEVVLKTPKAMSFRSRIEHFLHAGALPATGCLKRQAWKSDRIVRFLTSPNIKKYGSFATKWSLWGNDK